MDQPTIKVEKPGDQCARCTHTRAVHGTFSPPHTNDVPGGCAYCADYCTAFVEYVAFK